MIDDIFEQLSQRGSNAETAENFRIREVADELRRRCQLHEAQSRSGEENVIVKKQPQMTANRTHITFIQGLHTRPTANYSLLTANSSFTFSAKERDPETGLTYFGSRYYSSDLSIWLSVDPMVDKYASLSPYVYCADNPVRCVDPNGEEIVITETTDGNGNKVVNIKFTATLVNKSSENISPEEMGNYIKAIEKGIINTYAGKKDDGTIVNVDVDIDTRAKGELLDPLSTRHTINIVDKLDDQTHSAESKIGEGYIDIRLDICRGDYPRNPVGRTAAHEFGHLLGLDHVEDADNIMNPNTNGRVITGMQIQEACENSRKNRINMNIYGIKIREERRRKALKLPWNIY